MNVADSLSKLHANKNRLIVMNNRDSRRYTLHIARWYYNVNTLLEDISAIRSVDLELGAGINIPLSKSHISTIFHDYKTCSNTRKYRNGYKIIEGNVEYLNQTKIPDNSNRKRIMFFKNMGC